MTRDEAIRILESGLFDVCGGDSADAIDAIDFAIEDMKATRNNGWINAKDKLPKQNGQYLCVTMINGQRHTQVCLWYNGNWYWVHDVLYWMAPPDLPEEVEANG